MLEEVPCPNLVRKGNKVDALARVDTLARLDKLEATEGGGGVSPQGETVAAAD